MDRWAIIWNENLDIAIEEVYEKGATIESDKQKENRKKDEKVPCLSMFYGIIIYMYKGDYQPPHIHAMYQGDEACYDLEGNFLEGKLPNKKKKLVEAWITIHEEELKANWELLEDEGTICKIDPLK